MMMLLLLLIIFSINVIDSYKININSKNSVLYSNNNNDNNIVNDDNYNDNKIANNDLELQNQLDLYISKNLLLEQGIKLMRTKMDNIINENNELKLQLSNINDNKILNNDKQNKELIIILEKEIRLNQMKMNSLQLKLDNEILLKQDILNNNDILSNSNKKLSNKIDNLIDEANIYKSQIDSYNIKLKLLQKAYEISNNELKSIKNKYSELEKENNNLLELNGKNDIVNTMNEFMIAFKQQTKELQETQKTIQNVDYMITGDLRDQRQIIEKQTSLLQNLVSQLNTEEYSSSSSSSSSSIENINNIPISSTPTPIFEDSNIINDESNINIRSKLKIKKRLGKVAGKVARTVLDALSFLVAKGPYYETLSSSEDFIQKQGSKWNNFNNNFIIDTHSEMDSFERNKI